MGDTRGWWAKLWERAEPILIHGFCMCLMVVCIWAFGLLAIRLLGENFKFFDLLPLKYVEDFADLTVLGRFLWKSIKE